MTRTHAALDVSRAAEAMVFRAFVTANRDELARHELLDALGLGTYSPAQERWIGRIDRALTALVAEGRLVRVKKGVYAVLGRGAAA